MASAEAKLDEPYYLSPGVEKHFGWLSPAHFEIAPQTHDQRSHRLGMALAGCLRTVPLMGGGGWPSLAADEAGCSDAVVLLGTPWS
jgi:hypothetical protein